MEKVNHPKHYNVHPSGIECIEVVRHMSFNVGNAIKYLWRADEKGSPIEDLEKAAWYVTDEIKKRNGDSTSESQQQADQLRELLEVLESGKVEDAISWVKLAIKGIERRNK